MFSSIAPILRNASLLFSARFIQKTLAIVLVFFLTRKLDSTAFGQYSFVLTAATLSGIFSLPGLTNAVSQSTARGFLGTYQKANLLSFASTFLGSFGLLALAAWMLSSGHSETAYTLVIVSFLLPFSVGLTQWKAVAAGKEDFDTLFVIGVTRETIRVVLTIAALYAYPNSILIPVTLAFLFPAFQNATMTLRLHRQLATTDVTHEENSLTYGLKTSAYSTLGAITSQFNSFLIYFLLSPVALAMFTVATKLPDAMKMLLQDTATIMMPRFARMTSYTKRMGTWLSVLSYALAALTILFTFTLFPFFFLAIFGSAYREAVPYAQALMVSIALQSKPILNHSFIVSQLDSKSVKTIISVMSLSSIIASAILIPLYGIWGAVCSIFLQRIFTNAAISSRIKRQYAHHITP